MKVIDRSLRKSGSQLSRSGRSLFGIQYEYFLNTPERRCFLVACPHETFLLKMKNVCRAVDAARAPLYEWKFTHASTSLGEKFMLKVEAC